jgi:hypothetical protein
MVGEVFAAVGGFSALLNSARALKDMNDAAVRNAAVIDLQEKILAAQEAQAETAERIRALEKEVANFKAWKTEKEKYELKNLGRASALAYMLKANARGAEPPHSVCANCYSRRQISIIQYTGQRTAQRPGYICPACKSEVSPSSDVFADGQLRWLD